MATILQTENLGRVLSLRLTLLCFCPGWVLFWFGGFFLEEGERCWLGGLFCTLVNNKTMDKYGAFALNYLKDFCFSFFPALIRKASENVGEDITSRKKKSCWIWDFKIIHKNCIVTRKVW